ncbi:(2Fe-2S)-binding protein [Streptomyces sp. NPDC004031]
MIDEITALGPFFAFTTHPDPAADPGRAAPGPAAGAGSGEPVWQALDGPAVAARAEAVRAWLAAASGRPPEAVEARVGASVAHLGLAARLVSPALAAAVLHGVLLDHRLAAVRWQPVLGGPAPLSLPAAALRGPALPPAPLADAFAARLHDGPLAELAALHVPLGVSRHILLGNTASAVNGAAAMIAGARPDLAAATARFATALLDRAPLRAQRARTPAGAFRRRSCCLIYRAAPDRRGALCGDCALHPTTDTRP